MPNYELTYILRPLEDANLSAANERIANLVTSAGGTVAARHTWGRRRLAYPIRKINDGIYVTDYITLPTTAVRGLERALQLTEDVLRYLVVRVDTLTPPAAPPLPTPAAEVPGTTAPSAVVEPPPEASSQMEQAEASAEVVEAAPTAQAAPSEGS